MSAPLSLELDMIPHSAEMVWQDIELTVIRQPGCRPWCNPLNVGQDP
jgi:hypothetical protein